jgi:hypothetical protein
VRPQACFAAARPHRPGQEKAADFWPIEFATSVSEAVEMPKLEDAELARRRARIVADVKMLVEKYRAIFDWDAPEIDQTVADRLILDEIAMALREVQTTLPE